MENDASQILNDIIKKAEDSLNVDEEIDTITQARQLLQSWTNNTESFKTKSQKNDASIKKVTKTAKYRKLDAPMMVAKKVTNRPSVDPTLIIEARLAHVREMKAKRLERMENREKNSVSSKSQASSVSSVDIPDINAEINSYRMKMAERMKEKQKELDERSRRKQKNKVIDENMAILIAQENEDKTKIEDDDDIYDESFKCLVQSFRQFQIHFRKKIFFLKWVSECKFETKTYKKAEKLSNFRRKSSAFSIWKSQHRRRQQEREVSMLERNLRHEKQLESIADQRYALNTLRKALIQWKIKYKSSIEYKTIEEQHILRRNFITSKIDFNQIETNSPEPKNEPKVLKIPKAKIKNIKIDPKFEAMTKRMEEQKAKRLKKAQKEAEEIAFIDEKSYKKKMEIQRKKKEEHRLFLEQEKVKREVIKQKQEQYQRDSQRKKYCEQISQNFRLNKLKSNQFNQWKKILSIRSQLESIAHNHYINHLASSSLKGFILFSKDKKNQRDQNANAKFNCFVLQKSFYYWMNEYTKFKTLEMQVLHISNQWRLRRALDILFEEKLKRRKAKYSKAARHANKVLLRKFFNAWPIGCRILKNEEERESNRNELMSKALQFLEEIDSDDFDDEI